eukprot:snap_masked-scaffold_7-processed-gene-18.29-mRNA-1 protein AED:1.00 eAED:1.00 QI:0/-1/0/0/-1/1/1/0/281
MEQPKKHRKRREHKRRSKPEEETPASPNTDSLRATKSKHRVHSPTNSEPQRKNHQKDLGEERNKSKRHKRRHRRAKSRPQEVLRPNTSASKHSARANSRSKEGVRRKKVKPKASHEVSSSKHGKGKKLKRKHGKSGKARVEEKKGGVPRRPSILKMTKTVYTSLTQVRSKNRTVAEHKSTNLEDRLTAFPPVESFDEEQQLEEYVERYKSSEAAKQHMRLGLPMPDLHSSIDQRQVHKKTSRNKVKNEPEPKQKNARGRSFIVPSFQQGISRVSNMFSRRK